MRKACLTAISVALLVGCSTDITGSAVADSPTDQTFDPCTIPDTTITAAGLDPASKDSMADKGYTTPGWTICGWEGPAGEPWYSISVYASPTHTIEEVREDSRYLNMLEIEVADRSAVRYESTVAPRGEICDLAFATNSGLIKVSALKNGSSDTTGDLCAIVSDHTERLSSAIPS
ncbi:DUF3558 domain-containing protein [Rhodococcoides fascians]|uniref:DUF3558 domain-containing protein n=1 Tax=Rhodococcoides fascians TaxID=1828 RepID=UPI00056D0842|nr:DUF3558 domain-containing protein [Rhodococcus fascians]